MGHIFIARTLIVWHHDANADYICIPLASVHRCSWAIL